MTSYLDSPVFICGHRKGGTTVVVCLFDGHPQLLTLPIDSGFFYNAFPGQIKIGMEETISAVTSKTLRENLSNELVEVGASGFVDVEAIAERYGELARSQAHSPANHLRALMRSYGENCHQSSARWVGWVEKTTSSEIYAVEIAEWFPNARFIHITRDPRDNWASLRSGWETKYKQQESSVKDLLQTLLARAGLGLRMAQLNEEALGKGRYKVVRFEDMTRRPREVMEDLCRFIGIDYLSELETPTVAGHLWKGNNFEGLAFSALNNANTGRWAERIPGQEAALIEAHLGDVMEATGYNLECSPIERCFAASAHYKWSNTNRKF